jgi:hypothetical protein
MTLELDKSAARAETAEGSLLQAGTRGAGDYRCLDCGYGIVTFGLLPTCPMCKGSTWKQAASLAEH